MKTCFHGHPLTEFNTYWHKGYAYCRECKREAGRRLYTRRKEQRSARVKAYKESERNLTMTRQDKMRRILEERRGDWIESAISLIEPERLAVSDLQKCDTVLVELTYAEEQEYNGSMFYNENTNRLIAIDNPIVYRKE